VKWTLLSFMLLGCPRAAGPATAEAAPEAVEERVAEQGPVLTISTRVVMGSAEPMPYLVVNEDGSWVRGETAGKLAVEELASLRQQLNDADWTPYTPQPGELRCMAMPTVEWTLAAGANSTSWKTPCSDPPPEDVGRIKAWVDAL
jgi:hypothetical protein